MAALKENLPSPWHVNRTTDTLDRFRRAREEGLRKSENRRMELQGDILKLQQDKHLRAMCLQWHWQELTEREGRARRHNQQLLQDFQRAQVTLEEMVAHTAAMNAIRREYQRHLEESSGRWHRQLKGHTHAAQKKHFLQKEELLRDFVQRRKEEQVTKEHFSPPRENPFWSQGATSVAEDPCRADGLPGGVVPPTTSASSGLAQTHASHDASLLRSPAAVPQPGLSPVHRQASLEQEPLPWRAPQALWPSPWASGVAGSPPGLTALWAPPSMAGPPEGGLVPGRGAEAVGGTAPLAEGWGEKTCGGTCLSQELDIRPVRLSSAHGDSSDGSRDSGSGRNHQERRTREERRLHSGSDRKSIPQESAGTSSADSEVTPTTSATRRKRANKGQDCRAPSDTESNSTSRCLGTSAREQSEEKGTRIAPDQSGGHKKKSCRIVRVKSQSVVEESSRTEDEDPTDHSERSVRERGHQSEDSVSVSMKSKREPAVAAERVGEKVADVEEDLEETDRDVKHTDEDTSGENEEKRLTEEGEDEESQREENKEEEDKRGEDDEGQGSDASGEEEGQEQPGSSESESGSAAIPRAKEEQETKEFQAKIEDELDEEDEEEEEEDEEEEDKEEDGGGVGVGIDQPGQGPHTGESEKTDSDDSIILPQEHRSRKKVQSISEEVDDDADSGAQGEDGEESGAEGSLENSDSDDSDDDDGDIERLVAPQVDTKREREKELKFPDQTKAITKHVSLSEESDKTAEDTDDEFDHFYD